MASVTSWSSLILLKSNVTWQVAVVGVIDLFGITESDWVVESVKFLPGFFDIVFDTVTVFIINLSLGMSGKTAASLKKVNFLVLNWSEKLFS